MQEFEFAAPVDQEPVAVDVHFEYAVCHNTVLANFGQGMEPLFQILVYYPLTRGDLMGLTRDEIYAKRDAIEAGGISKPL